MHKSIHTTALPPTEYRRLQMLMLTMIGGRSVFAAILRRKLGSTTPALSWCSAAEIAVSGRCVRFTIDGKHVEERMLTWQPQKRADAASLSLLSPRGLALLGLSPGASITYRTEGGGTEFLKVETVSIAEIEDAPRSVSAVRTELRRSAPSAPPVRPAVPVTFAGASNG